MKNKTIGLLIIGIAVLVGLIIFSFNRALTQIVNTACTHGPTCPMWGTIEFQTNIGLGILVFIVLVGLYFIFFMKDRKGIIEEKKEEKKINYVLDEQEKNIINLLKNNDNSMYQSDLIKQTNLSKVKITRILDKLEAKKLIERKRRGMTNIVILRN